MILRRTEKEEREPQSLLLQLLFDQKTLKTSMLAGAAIVEFFALTVSVAMPKQKVGNVEAKEK
jgi:hypothetical protein